MEKKISNTNTFNSEINKETQPHITQDNLIKKYPNQGMDRDTTLKTIQESPSIKKRTIQKELKPDPIKDLPVPLTGIKFTMPIDTHVYVDDIEVRNLDQVYIVNPGKHRIKMIRNNFTPIESHVDVLSEQTTKINVAE